MWRLYGSATVYARRPLPTSTICSARPNGPGAARGFAVATDFKAALLRYRELHHHPLVPLKFEVPAECAGMRLGAQAGEYRQKWRALLGSPALSPALSGPSWSWD